MQEFVAKIFDKIVENRTYALLISLALFVGVIIGIPYLTSEKTIEEPTKNTQNQSAKPDSTTYVGSTKVANESDLSTTSEQDLTDVVVIEDSILEEQAGEVAFKDSYSQTNYQQSYQAPTAQNPTNTSYSIIDTPSIQETTEEIIDPTVPVEIVESDIWEESEYNYQDDTINVDFGDKDEDDNSSKVVYEAPVWEDVNGELFTTVSNWLDRITNRNLKSIEFALVDAYDSRFQSAPNIDLPISDFESNVWNDIKNFFVRIYQDNANNVILDKEDGQDIIINKSVLSNVNVKYQIIANRGIKEEIVVVNNSNVHDSYVFTLKLEDGVQYRKNTNYQIDAPEDVYYFTDQTGNYIAHFIPLVAEDMSGSMTENVTMDIERLYGNDHKITITVDPEWMYSPDRKFPIIVDPSIVHDTQTEFDTAESLNRTTTTSDPSIELSGPPYNDYGVYTSDVLNLGTSSPQVDTLSWTENGVQTGDGEIDLTTNGLVAKWNFNETSGTSVSDASGNGHTGTLINMTTTGQDASVNSGWTANNKKWGAGALMFDGNNDYIEVSHNDDLNFERTDPFSVNTWLQFNSLSNYQHIVGKNDASLRGWYLIKFANTDPNRPNSICLVITSVNATNDLLACTPSNSIQPGVMYHIVSTYNGNSDVSGTKIYFNGVEQTVTAIRNILTGSIQNSGTIRLGLNLYSSGSYPLNGIMDSTTIYSRVLSSDEVLSNYNISNIEFQTRTGTDANPYDGGWEEWKPAGSGTEAQLNAFDNQYLYDESESDLVLYWPMDEETGTNIDDPVNNDDGTTTDTVIVDGKFGKARAFNGSTSDIGLSSYSGSSANSISMWIKPNEDINNSSGCMSLTDLRSNGSSDYFYIGLGACTISLSNEVITILHDNNGRTAVPNISLEANKLYKLDINWNGSFYDIYINSEAQSLIHGTGSNYAAPLLTNSNQIYLGSSASGASNFSGIIDEFKLYNSNRSSSAISDDYFTGTVLNSYSPCLIQTSDSVLKTEGTYSQKTTFGQPKVDENTVALWHLDETSGSGAYLKDSSGNSYDGTPTGTTVVDGINTKARDFNGTNYIDFSSSVASDMNGASAVTVEAWIKADNASDWGQIFYTTATSNYSKFDISINSSEQIRVGGRASTSDGFQSETTTSSVSTSDWTHVVGVIDVANDDIKIYFDGVEQSTTGSPSFGNTTFSNETGTYHRMGYQTSGYPANYYGYIDEVRVTSTELTNNEIYESYRLGRDHYVNNSITTTDLSSASKLPIYVASDQPGENYDLIIGESEYANYQPDENTLGLWHMEEESGSGAYIKDSSGNSNDGTPNNPTSSSGYIGKSISFNGTSSYVGLGDVLGFSGQSSAITIDAWVYPTTNKANNYIVSKQLNYLVYGDAGGSVWFMQTDNGNLYHNQWYSTNKLTVNEWNHVVVTYDGTGSSGCKIYVNNQTGTTTYHYDGGWTNSGNLYIGSGSSSSGFFSGKIDEMRISDIARTPEEIRQAYEVGLRTHSITFDFAASLDNANTISGSGDTSFTVDATTKGLASKGTGLYVGDTIIIKENYNGTEYIAQGIVDAVNYTTGATTVASWNAGSTFPSGGFTQYADVFKWQREYWDLTEILDDHLETTQLVTLRKTNGDSGSTIWLDDLNSVSNYMTNPSGTTINSTSNQYIQYRAILSTNNENITPSLSDVTLNYNNAGPVTITGGSTSESVLNNFNKNAFNIQCNGVNYYPTSTITCYASWDNTNWETVGSASSPISDGTIQGTPDVTTWTGYPATDGNHTLYVRAYADGDYTTSESFTINVDRVEPTITSISSVGGDTSSPYADDTDDGDTLIVYTTSVDADTCKWDTIDTDYDLMSNTCSSTTNCQVGEYGGGEKDIYIRCIDTSARKASTSYHIEYTQEWGGYVRTIDLDSATTMDNYQVRVDLNTINFDYSKVEANGSDIRFTDTNGNLLDYWIQEWNATGDSKIWVELPNSGTDEFNMYYGNGNPTSTSNGDDTFLLFDDFEDATIDTNKWTASSSDFNRASITESGGVVTFQQQAVNGIYAHLDSNTQFGYNTAFEQRSNVYFSNPNNSAYNVGYGYGDSSGFGGTRISFLKPELDTGTSMQVETGVAGEYEAEYLKTGGSGMHDYKITRLENDVEWFVDDSSVQTHTEDGIHNTVSDANLTIRNGSQRFDSPSVYTWYYGYAVDWIFVRNFEGTDPSETLGDEGSAVTNLPAVSSISSVASDSSAPYTDVSDDGSTLVIFSTENDANNIKWDTSDVDYDSMSNDCGNITQCILDLTGEGSKTVYFRATDGANKSDSSYQLDYTIQSTQITNLISSSSPKENDLTLTVTLKPSFNTPITDGSIKLIMADEFDFTGLTVNDVEASGGDVTWTNDEQIFAGGSQIALNKPWFVDVAKAQGENSITFNFTGDIDSSDGEITFIISGIDTPDNPPTEGSYSYIVEWYELNNAGGSPLYIQDGKVHINTGTTVTASVPTSFTFIVDPVGSGSVNNATITTSTVTGDSTNFGTFSSADDRIASHDLIVSTNSSNGYVITTQYSNTFQSAGGDIMNNFTGTNTTPTTWSTPPSSGTESYFGYTTNDSSLLTNSIDRFTSSGGNKWAAFTTTPNEVAYSAIPTVDETTRVGYRLEITNLQPAGTYTTNVMYIATPTF